MNRTDPQTFMFCTLRLFLCTTAVDFKSNKQDVIEMQILALNYLKKSLAKVFKLTVKELQLFLYIGLIVCKNFDNKSQNYHTVYNKRSQVLLKIDFYFRT